MGFAMLGIMMAVLAQSPQLPAEDAQIYRIIFEDGSERYGAVEESGMQVKIYYDTPWAPQPPETILKRRVKLEELTSALRKSRQKEEAARMGYEVVRTDYGESWVLRDEIDYADRAKAMLWRHQEEEEALIASVTPLAGVQASGPVSTDTTPNVLVQYGLHALLALVGLVLSGLVFKALVLSE